MSDGMENPKETFFAMEFTEAAMVYSILFERALSMPPIENLMDEIERRELYVQHRAQIPEALKQAENLRLDLREYVMAIAGETQVLNLEAQVKKMYEHTRGRT